MNGSSKNGGGGRLRSQERFSILGDLPAFKDNPPTTGSSSSNGGSRGGRGRNRRRRKASPSQPGPRAQPQLHDPDAKPSRRRRRRGRRGRRRSGGEQPNAAAPAAQTGTKTGIDAFELFCAYHLGIGEDGRYHTSNIHDVARRFNTSAGGIREALSAHGLDSETVINSDFDMAMAQYDIQVAPEGLDLKELARNLLREFREASPNVRNWEQELAEDAAANAKTFGNDDD